MFMIWKGEYWAAHKHLHPGMNSNEFNSKIASPKWRSMTAEEKSPYKKLADEEKRKHALMHPNYQYKPARKPKSETGKAKRGRKDDSSSRSASATSASCSSETPLELDEVLPTTDVVMGNPADASTTRAGPQVNVEAQTSILQPENPYYAGEGSGLRLPDDLAGITECSWVHNPYLQGCMLQQSVQAHRCPPDNFIDINVPPGMNEMVSLY
jgi:hypothetical protein